MANIAELSTRVVRDAGFSVLDHGSGFTAIRDREGGEALLIFALAPSCACPLFWELRSNRAPADALMRGHGLASLCNLLRSVGLLNSEIVAEAYGKPVIDLTPDSVSYAAAAD